MTTPAQIRPRYSQSFPGSAWLALLAGIVFLSSICPDISAGVVVTPLVTFYGTNGANPQFGLTKAADQNFYGTTPAGGVHGMGTIFSLDTTGSFSLLHSFTGGNEGSAPSGPLIEFAGNFFGVTAEGGPNGAGTIFSFNPAAGLVQIHSFGEGIDGVGPSGWLAAGTNGSLYGATLGGGSNNLGTIFCLTPPAGSSSGTYQQLYSFTGGRDGSRPSALVLGNDGSFYGTARGGGAFNSGIIFKITPAGSLSLVHTFTGTSDGAGPQSGLLKESGNTFYGTTAGGGASGAGTLFKLTVTGSSGYTLTTLHSFSTNEAVQCSAPVIRGADGLFYGTAFLGGAQNRGSVFSSDTTGKVAVVHSFASGTGGIHPRGGLVQGSDGNFYGTASSGGKGNMGTVFRVSGFTPMFTTQPTNQTVLSGTTVLMSASAVGSAPLIYQWQLNSSKLSDHGNVSGTTNSTLAISNATSLNSGQYSVTVKNGFGAITSSVATVTIRENPSASISKPANHSVVEQASISVSGRATDPVGIAEVRYQLNGGGWRTATPVNGWNQWRADVSLVAGTNLFEVYSLNVVAVASPTVSAQFVLIPNPFIPRAGTYNGLFRDPNSFSPESAGFFTSKVTTKGALSGKFQIGSKRYPLTGVFDTNGFFQAQIERGPTGPMLVNLTMDLNSTEGTIVGSLNSQNWTAALSAHQARMGSSDTPLPEAGQYTMLMDVGSDRIPGGLSCGTLKVSSSGLIRFTGTCSDGTKVTQATAMCQGGNWPLYVPLYSGAGALWAPITFTSGASEALGSADAFWAKPALSTARYYPEGFTNQAVVSGWRYQRPVNGGKVLDLSEGNVVLEGGDLSEPFTNTFALGTNNRVTDLGQTQLKLKFSPSTGSFSGSCLQPGAAQPFSFQGVVLQEWNEGYGFFLGPDQSGMVILKGN